MDGTTECLDEDLGALAPTPGAPPAQLAALLARFAKTVKARLRSHDLRRHGIDEDDVEQEVRIRLWAALERGPGQELPGAYVQKVVLTTIIDAVRRERTRRRELGENPDAIDALCADEGRQPERMLAQAQWAEQVRDCINRLPRRRRRPVQLYLLGYTMQETATANGLTLDAGSKLVRRGLADLRTLLRRHYGSG